MSKYAPHWLISQQLQISQGLTLVFKIHRVSIPKIITILHCIYLSMPMILNITFILNKVSILMRNKSTQYRRNYIVDCNTCQLTLIPALHSCRGSNLLIPQKLYSKGHFWYKSKFLCYLKCSKWNNNYC